MNNNNYDEFLLFVEEHSKELEKEEKNIVQFLLKVPEKYLDFVKKGIHICGSLERFKKTVPLFEEKFTRQDKACADSVIVSDKKQNRKLVKKTKQALLWAGQLLRAVGGVNKTSIAPYVVVNEYLRELEQQELFCLRTKLMSVNGKLVKMTTPKQRKIQRNAKAFRQVKLFEEICKQKGWKFGLLTLTLPPIFHPNPTVSKRNSYCGASPQEAVDTINKFWVLIRSELSHYGFVAGEDFNGIRVYEGHKDSCIHSHIMIFIHPDNMKALETIIKNLEKRQRIEIANKFNVPVKDMKLKWDFRPEWDNKNPKKKAKASSYLFKYISPDINDKDTLANDALCSAYGIRRIQFFGLKNKISTFEFICKYWKAYEPYIENKEVVEMLRNKNLNLFHFKYQQDFENVNEVKKTRIVNGKVVKDYRMIGVSYIPNRNTELKQKEILITKRQYVLVENEDKKFIKKYGEDMLGLNFDDDKNNYDSNVDNALKAYPKAQEKQIEFNNTLLAYFKKQSFKGIDNLVPVCNCYYSETNEEVIKQYWKEELEQQKKSFELNFVEDYFYEYNDLKKPSELELDISSELLVRTLKQHYSRKNASHFLEEEKTLLKQSEDEEINELTT